jgi:hypothetical protein
LHLATAQGSANTLGIEDLRLGLRALTLPIAGRALSSLTVHARAHVKVRASCPCASRSGDCSQALSRSRSLRPSFTTCPPFGTCRCGWDSARHIMKLSWACSCWSGHGAEWHQTAPVKRAPILSADSVGAMVQLLIHEQLLDMCKHMRNGCLGLGMAL